MFHLAAKSQNVKYVLENTSCAAIYYVALIYLYAPHSPCPQTSVATRSFSILNTVNAESGLGMRLFLNYYSVKLM